MIKVDYFTASGKKAGTKALPRELLAEKLELSTLAQAVRVYQANVHIGHRRTKTRSEIARTKAKWYKQKGTGRARHGARSAHIFVGGGVAHGPTGLKRTLKLPRALAGKALSIAISKKAKEGKVFVADVSKIKKTSQAAKIIKSILKSSAQKSTFIVSGESPSARAISNLDKVTLLKKTRMNAFQIYFGGINFE